MLVHEEAHTHTNLDFSSNSETRMNQIVLIQERPASPKFSWFIPTVAIAAPQCASTLQQQHTLYIITHKMYIPRRGGTKKRRSGFDFMLAMNILSFSYGSHHDAYSIFRTFFHTLCSILYPFIALFCT